MKYLFLYLILINALALILMLTDKQKSRKKRWRISEATLMGFAALGGSLGALSGMYLFHHKTKHPKFYLGVPALLALHMVILFFVIKNTGV